MILHLVIKLLLLWSMYENSYQCSEGCADCRSGKVCYGCKDGYFYYSQRCSKCYEGCSTCTRTNTDCRGRCKPGRWGEWCQYSCIPCEDCSDLVCTSHCKDADSSRCRNQCPGKCTVNFTGPRKNHTGDTCNTQRCGGGCAHCAQDGHCTTCQNGYFLIYNYYKNYRCSKCPENCATCSTVSYANDSVDCQTCKDGYYLHAQGKRYRCSECPAKCKTCKSQTYTTENVQCATCIVGFYLHSYNNQYRCTCADGYYLSENKCKECPHGFWGHECKFSCIPCSECASYVCSRDCVTKTGTAFCQHTQSKCHNICFEGFIGQRRKNDIGTTSTTSLTTGVVPNTTQTPRQHTTESTTKINTKPDTTTSNHQSTEPITEPKQTTIPLKTTSFSKDATTLKAEAQTNDSGSTVLYIVIAVIAGLVLTGVCVAIICIKRGKRTSRLDQESSANVTNKEEYTYAKHNKVKKTDSQKGQSNELDLLNKDPSSAPASEQGHEKSNRGCSDVTSHVTDTVLAIDGIVLENCLDESETTVIEESSSAGQSKEDDTYYNVLSIKRNLVKVDKFEEYVTSKSPFDFYTEFEKFPKGLSRPHTHAKKPENKVKCRYNGVYPYDTNRVKLQDTANDFINASYIDGYTRQKEYIACLGPTKETMPDFVDFWAMIWQDKVEKIVMLTKLVEETKMKCEQYWPDNNKTISYGDVTVTCQIEDLNTDYTFRTLSVKKGETTRLVYQTHFLSWPDKRVPETTHVLLTLRDKVRAVKSEMEGPIVVHCSAGVGRTGTFIALDILLQQLKEERAVDVFGCVIGIRGQRVAMVQTLEQYEYIHNVLLESIQKTK